MSSAIVVPLDEMNQFAGQWRMSVTDMDAMVQQIARDIANISDNAKGLNDVRARGRTIGSQHRQLLDRGMAVHMHVTASVQRFTQADQELAGMVRSQQNVNLTDFIRQNNLGMLGQFPSFGVMTNGAASNFIEQLINFGEGTNLINEIGLTYPKLAKTFAKYTDNLFKLWPTTKKGIESSKNLASEFGLTFDLISMIKDFYESRVAAGQGDVALSRGDGQTAYQKFDQAYNKNLDVIATGTLALVGLAVSTPAALVLGAVQVASLVTDWGSDVARSHGYTAVADTLNLVSDVTDLHSHVKSVWDAGFNAYQNPHQALKQATDFVDHTANQIKDTASNMYQNATAWAKSWIW